MRHLVNRLALFALFGLLVIATAQETFAYAPNLFQQSTQEPLNVGSLTGGENDVRALEQGKPHRREMASGRRHTYRIRLAADQFLKAVIEQDGIDVVVSLSGPDGKEIMEFDSESRLRGQEVISQVAEEEGGYQLVVEAKLKRAPAGAYEIRIEELRAATESDRALQVARKLYDDSLKLQRAGKYEEARPLAERALSIREKALGPEHTDVADSLHSLAELLKEMGEYAKAEPLYQRALDIRERTLGPEHPKVAVSLSRLAVLYREMGEYAKAEPLYQRALMILERALGPEHISVGVVLNSLANFYWNLGDYAKAEPVYQRALTICERALGPEHLTAASILNNLAALYREGGEYVKAEPLYQRALEIREKALGPEHPDVADSLNSLAIFYRDRGDYGKVEPLFQRSLAIRKKALGPEHPLVALSLHNLANFYSERGEQAKAEPLYQRALEIREKALGPEHFLVANSHSSHANLYSERGDSAKAEQLHQRALAIRKKALGPEHSNVADSLNGLATLYRRCGDYAKSEPLYQEALFILEKAWGSQHPEVAVTLNNLAALYATTGVAQAIALQARANAVSEYNLALNLATGSERQKLAYLATLSKQTDQTISLHTRFFPDDSMARNLATTLILQRKGRALDATSESLNALRDRFSAEDRALLDRLTDARSQIARLVLNRPRGLNADQYRDRVKTLEDRAEKFEAEISRRSDEFRARSLPVTLEAVEAAIPDDAALIEFASYRPFNPKAAKEDEAYGQPRYVAYVLRRQGEIQWKELGEAKAVDESVAKLRKALRDPKRKDVKRLARAVDEKVFRPLRPLLGDVTRLLISPEGALNLIPFEALVDDRRRYLVERYSISYLSSGRDLLRLQVARESQSGPLVVADPDFGGRRQVEAMRLLKQKKGRLKDQAKEETPASAFSQFYFPALPYTAVEGEALRELLPGATLLTKRRASKEALEQTHSPTILHIATHGFFLEGLKLPTTEERSPLKSDVAGSRRLRQVVEDGSGIENPLLRAGLALAGANEHKVGDNGIMTALEVTGLNLWGTKLVTLSACDTGVGEVRSGDGVHGLRRALALAGAETQVMSLWPVSDRWTKGLMVSYYRGLRRGEGRGAALRQAQLEMLKDVKRRHPYYWAGFILSGEWANLEGHREK
jgi:CHAT domain-containing protein/Tfp pilus assembly protein PilF